MKKSKAKGKTFQGSVLAAILLLLLFWPVGLIYIIMKYE